MLDALRPANVLPAALAGWALGLLVLAALGLGANFGPHPDDAALAPPLPKVQLAQDAPRLGPPSQYAEVGQRPLLLPSRRPAAVTAVGAEEKPLDFVLTGVLIAGDFRAAMLQTADGQRSLRVRVGDLVEGTAWRLSGLEPRAAVFDGPEGQRRLDLRVYDGSGDPVRPPVPPPATAANGRGPSPATAPAAKPGAPAAAKPETARSEPLSEEAQVEAIRRRIEARRAQMREQAAREGQ